MHKAHVLFFVSVSSLGLCAPAMAQTAATPATTAGAPETTTREATKDAPDSHSNAEIVVTALRRATSVITTPAAITALSGDDLKSLGVNTVNDLQNIVPGVTIDTSQDGVTIAIRGVRTTDTSSKGEQDIAFNIDGQYVGRGNARTVAFFDLDRVEVLRGPQGTLYGRSSTGGAINLVTQKPKLGEFSGYIKTEIGNYSAKRAEGAINIPLGSTLAFRLAGNGNYRDGYTKPIDSTVVYNGTTYNFSAANSQARNDQKDATGRASLYFEPSKDFSARVTATFGHQRGAGSTGQLESYLSGGGSVDRQLAIYATPVKSFVKDSFFNVDGDLNYKLGGTQIDVTGSHQYYHLNQQLANIGNPVNNPDFFTGAPTWGLILQDTPTNTTQTEARLSNVNPGRLDYVLGANYFYEVSDETGHLFRAPLNSDGSTSTFYHFFQVFNHTSHRAFGAFGQGTFHLNDKLSFVGGLRWTKDSLNRTGYIALPFQCQGISYPNSCGSGTPNAGGSSDTKITYRAGVNYQASPRTLIYGSVATGFKGGGFNDFSPGAANPFVPNSFGASSLTAYELGYKGRPFDHFTLATDVFYYDFSKNQINQSIAFPALGAGSQQLTVTAPTSIYGIENEFSYQFTSLTSVSGTVSYQRSSYRNLLAGSIAGDQVQWRGLDLDQTPRFVASLSAEHGIELGSNGKLTLRGQMKYSSGYYLSDIGNAVRYHQPSYTRSNLTLTYSAPKDRFSVQLFVENLENKLQRSGGVSGYTGPYGGTGGQTASNTVVYPTPGNGTITPQPFGYMGFNTSSPRFFGARFNAKF